MHERRNAASRAQQRWIFLRGACFVGIQPSPCRIPLALLFVQRYAILSPYANGNTEGNYRSRPQFSQMVAVDLNDFTIDGVSVVDLAATSRQQVRNILFFCFGVLPAGW